MRGEHDVDPPGLAASGAPTCSLATVFRLFDLSTGRSDAVQEVCAMT